MRWEKIVHDHEMDFPPARQLDSMKTVKAGEKSMRVILDVSVIVFQNGTEEFVFGM